MDTRQALIKAAEQLNERRFTQFRLRMGLLRPRIRREIELCLADEAIRAGVIEPGNLTDDGIVGDWTDFFSYIIENWETVLQMVMDIITIFSMFA